MPRERLIASPLALVIGLLAGAAVAGEDAPPEPAQAPRGPLIGPIISDIGPEGFVVRIGTVSGPAPGAARLLVFDAADRPGPDTAPLAKTWSALGLWHELRATGLSPGRRYRYRLSLDNGFTSDGEISTAPPPGSTRPLTFAVMGDERGYETWVSPFAVATVRAVLAESPDLVLGTGDLVAEGGAPAAWQEFWNTHGPMLAQLPYLPALGNHELMGDPQGRYVQQVFPQLGRAYYALRYGAALFVFLNGNRPGDAEQTRFLDDELGRPDPAVRRRFVVLHHSPFSVAQHCGLYQPMAPWIDRFERYHVDAVFSGHDHVYQRLERRGVAYFVTGGAGAPLYPRGGGCGPTDEAALQHFESTYHYLMVRIDPQHGDRVSVAARSPQGPVFDSVTLPLARSPAPPFPKVAALAPQPPLSSLPWALYLVPAGLLGAGWYLSHHRRRRAAPGRAAPPAA